MNGKLLEVREFDKISCNPDFKAEYAYLPEDTFHDLQEFIYSFSSDKEYSDALEFLKPGYRRNVGDIISVSNYVGLIQMRNGYQIQVLPKIDLGTDEDNGNQETKRIFLRMLRSIKDFPGKVFNEANLKMDKMTLYEIFINMYLQEVRNLVKRGIKSSYVLQEGNLKFFKGKLAVNENIKLNIAHKERFFVRYDDYLVDRPENRLIKSTLFKLYGITESAENKRDIRRLLTAFEMVNPSTNYQRDFSRVVIDRNTKDYDMLMRWSRVFLLNKSFSTFSGSQNARALLFPMERVFESYIAQQLKKALCDSGCEVTAQDKGHYLFDSPKRFALRPDIVITREDGSKIVLDTKWKSLVNSPQNNYGISQADMYQMYVYSKKYETSEVWLIYPINNEMRGNNEISFKSNDGVSVRLFFVDLARERFDESVRTLCDQLVPSSDKANSERITE